MAKPHVLTMSRSYRRDTQDRVGVVEVGAAKVIVLADGAGGRSGGTEAAEAVIRLARESLDSVNDPLDPRGWARMLMRLDRLIREDARAGETTAVTVAVTEKALAGAAV